MIYQQSGYTAVGKSLLLPTAVSGIHRPCPSVALKVLILLFIAVFVIQAVQGGADL